MKKTILILLITICFVSSSYALTPKQEALLKQIHRSELEYEMGLDKIKELEEKPNKTQKEIKKLNKKKGYKIKDENTIGNWKSQLATEGVTDFLEFRQEVLDELIVKEEKKLKDRKDEKDVKMLLPDIHNDIDYEGLSFYDAVMQEYNRHKKASDDRIKKLKKIKKENPKW